MIRRLRLVCTKLIAAQVFLLVRKILTLGQASLPIVPDATMKRIVVTRRCQLNGLTTGKGGSLMVDWRNLWNGTTSIPLQLKFETEGSLSGEIIGDGSIVGGER